MRRHFAWTALRVLLGLLLAGAPRPGRAEAGADDSGQLARAHHAQATTLFTAGRFREALTQFQAAYALAPFPGLLYNIARCHEELAEWPEAIEQMSRYLTVAPPNERVEVRERLEALRRRANLSPTPPSPAPPVPPPTAGPHLSEPTVAVAIPPTAQAPARRPWRWRWAVLGTGLGLAVLGLGIGLGVGLALRDDLATLPPPRLAAP